MARLSQLSRSIAGKVALVTGAAGGMGRATAHLLADEGARVAVTDLTEDGVERVVDEIRGAGGEASGWSLDVTGPDRIRSVVAEVAEGLGGLDILINNAGLGRAMGSLATASLDDIEQTIDTNVTAAIYLIRVMVPGMIERRRGHLVNMSSVLALYPAPAALYGATKGAMHKLSRDLRHELTGTGVRVTEINPGRVATEFYDVAIDDAEVRDAVKASGIEDLTPADVAASVVHVLDAPRHVNISQLEIVPTEQVYGGAAFNPVEPPSGPGA